MGRAWVTSLSTLEPAAGMFVGLRNKRCGYESALTGRCQCSTVMSDASGPGYRELSWRGRGAPHRDVGRIIAWITASVTPPAENPALDWCSDVSGLLSSRQPRGPPASRAQK